jgi:hypothetical protein
MTSLKQIEANRRNALKSTGPRTEQGKHRSRQNALRHGLTAETVIPALENAVDYSAFEASIMAEYQPRSATQRELVLRLASLLWRLRRSSTIETGLFQIQGELIRNAGARRRRTVLPPQWLDEKDVAATVDNDCDGARNDGQASKASDSAALADCFLQVSRLGYGTFDLLTRYETALWRQAAQIIVLLSAARR